MHNLGEYKNTHPYLTEEGRVALARDYLIHEFRKIFPIITRDETSRAIKKLSPNKDSHDIQIRDFWNLFSAICSGWRIKNLFNVVTNKNIKWAKRQVSLQELYPESPLGWMKQIKPYRYNDAINFLKAKGRANKELEDSIKSRGLRAEGDEQDPIIVLQAERELKVIDGNSRLKISLEKLVVNKQEDSRLMAWVGHGAGESSESEYWIPTSHLVFMKEIDHPNIESKLKSISKLALTEYLKRVKDGTN
jgi:hypothetical protein